MMQINVSTTEAPRIASSDRVAAKAAALAVRYLGDGDFAVASGSEPGKVYTVTITGMDTQVWPCTCAWADKGGLYCSHVRAAEAEALRIRAARQRAAAKAAAAVQA